MTPPQDRGKRRPQYTGDNYWVRLLPRYGAKTAQAPDSEGKAEKTRTKQSEVLHKDKRALEATSSNYSTESDEEGEVLASSSCAKASA